MSLQVHSPVSALVARDVVRAYAGRVVLDGVDLVANPGQALGLVGENGAGKSTLLRILAGNEQSDSGSIAAPGDLAYLSQDPAFPRGATVTEVLREALSPLHRAVARLEELAGDLDQAAAQEEYADLLEWAVLHDAWDAGRRAQAAAARLGLGGLDHDRPAESLSGGQRMRLALAALITRRPACVLLDEPSNHLDDAAVTYVEEWLAGLPGVVVVASHDRTFLDNVCTTVVDLDPMHVGLDGAGGNRFAGGYSDYLLAKRASRARWEASFLAHQDELNGLRQSARTTARSVAPHNRPPRDNDKFIYVGKGQRVAKAVSRRVRDTERRIAVLEQERVPKPPMPLVFRGSLTGERGIRGSVHARDLVVPGRVRVPRLDVSVGDRLLVTGANGSGKSTLLKVLSGDLPARGHLEVAARRVGHLPQEATFARPERPVAEVYDWATGSAAPLADLGLLHPRELSRSVGVLSVGQQRRLALAILIARQPDLLLLDEPTNHISLALADELEEALQRSAGTVIVASHDRWLRRRWDGSRLAL